jgi:hypothetical protein
MARLISTNATGPLLLLSVAMGAFAGCASAYYRIQPLNIKYYYEEPVEGDTAVTIAYQYDVLRYAGNNKYARLEYRAGISLLGIRVNNYGNDTLSFPENFAFYADTIQMEPLMIGEFFHYITQTNNTVNHLNNDNFIVIDHWVADVPGLTYDLMAGTADVVLYKELEKYYLVNSIIPPHSVVQGLVALPIEKETPIRVAKR